MKLGSEISIFSSAAPSVFQILIAQRVMKVRNAIE